MHLGVDRCLLLPLMVMVMMDRRLLLVVACRDGDGVMHGDMLLLSCLEKRSV